MQGINRPQNQHEGLKHSLCKWIHSADCQLPLVAQQTEPPIVAYVRPQIAARLTIQQTQTPLRTNTQSLITLNGRGLVGLFSPPLSLPLPPIPSHPHHPVSQH
jgi:hypothetical protein